jgi:hypothetical protein
VEPFYRLLRALNGQDPVGNIEGIINNSFGPGSTYTYSWNTIALHHGFAR